MTVYTILAAAVASYLLGSINTAIIVSRATLGVDIRDYGSGNAGATNALRTMGGWRTVLVSVGDITKGALASLAGFYICNGEPGGKLVAAIFVVVGHMYPLFFRFRGGKGVLTSAIMVLMFDWRIGLIGLSIFALVVLLTRFVSLGSMIAVISVSVMIAIFYDGELYFIAGIVLALLVAFAHRSNIARLLKGEESRFSFKSRVKIQRKPNIDHLNQATRRARRKKRNKRRRRRGK